MTQESFDNKLKLIDLDDEGMKLTQKGREISNSVFVEFME